MLCFNGIYLCLSLFMVCYVHIVESGEHRHVENIPQSTTPQNNLNGSKGVGDVLQTNTQGSYPPNIRDKYAVTETTSVEDGAINSTDRGRRMETYTEQRNELLNTRRDLVTSSDTANEQRFALSTDQPLLGKFVYGDSDVTRNSSAGKYLDKASNLSSLLVAIISNYDSNYDVIKGYTYLCNSERECKLLLDNSTCQLKELGTVGSGKCICIEGYVFEGKKCIPKDSVSYCSIHSDCDILANSRCTQILSTRTVKICKCLPNHIIDNNKCLPKVLYGEYCISSKQCPTNTQCLSNYCRPGCSMGYIWKDYRCVKDPPNINIDYFSKDDSFLSNTGILIAIVVGLFIPVALIFFTLAVAIRRRFARTRPSLRPRNRENAESCFQTSPYYTVSDQPPAYEEIMTSSTATLVANAQEISEDPPPSYSSWQEDTAASAARR